MSAGPSWLRRAGVASTVGLGLTTGGWLSILSSVTVGTECSRACSVLNASLCGSSISSAYMLLQGTTPPQVSPMSAPPSDFAWFFRCCLPRCTLTLCYHDCWSQLPLVLHFHNLWENQRVAQPEKSSASTRSVHGTGGWSSSCYWGLTRGGRDSGPGAGGGGAGS